MDDDTIASYNKKLHTEAPQLANLILAESSSTVGVHPSVFHGENELMVAFIWTAYAAGKDIIILNQNMEHPGNNKA